MARTDFRMGRSPAIAIVIAAVTATTALVATTGGRGHLTLPSVIARAVSPPTCAPTVEATYALPPTPLHVLNPWLATDPSAVAWAAASAANVSDCHPDGDVMVPCYAAPAIGSGLARLSRTRFIGLTDRGPNQDCEDLAASDPVRHAAAAGKVGKGFYLPSFSPALVYFELPSKGRMKVSVTVPLVGTHGERVSGLPNSARDDTPYGANCVGEPLPLDVGGIDPEEVSQIPGTDILAVVEEYGPSVLLVHRQTGVIVARHVPSSVAPLLAGAPYPVIGSLPAVFGDRRLNRGFESLAVAPSGTHLYAILQSPLGDEKADGLKKTVVIRGLKMRIERASRNAVTLAYDSQFALEASSPAAWTAATKPVKPTKIKLSAAAAIADDAFVLLEHAEGQVLLYRIDVTPNTTSLDATSFADNTELERLTGGTARVSDFGVTPASKRLLWNSAAAPGWAGVEQQEGIAVEQDGRLLLVSDNDFGIEDGTTVVTRLDVGRGLDGCAVCAADAPITAAGNVTPGGCEAPPACPYGATKSGRCRTCKESKTGGKGCKKEDDDD